MLKFGNEKADGKCNAPNNGTVVFGGHYYPSVNRIVSLPKWSIDAANMQLCTFQQAVLSINSFNYEFKQC